jgi:hypothetical protein
MIICSLFLIISRVSLGLLPLLIIVFFSHLNSSITKKMQNPILLTLRLGLGASRSSTSSQRIMRAFSTGSVSRKAPTNFSSSSSSKTSFSHRLSSVSALQSHTLSQSPSALVRFYSGAPAPTLPQIQERVLQVLKDFDKVDQAKVTNIP